MTSWGIGQGLTRLVDTLCTPSDSFVAFNSWKDAYSRYTAVCEKSWTELLSFKTWCVQQGSKVYQFKYWQTVDDMEMLLVRIVSLREVMGWNIRLGVHSRSQLRSLAPGARRDMMNVWVKHPDPYRQFADGFVTIAKTQNHFSIIGFDQNHEQRNKELKMHGGTLNLSDECVFTEWAEARPENARVPTEFEVGMLTRKNAVFKHHVQSPSVQQRFVAHSNALVIHFKKQVTRLTRISTKSSLSTPDRLCRIRLPAVSWVHIDKERSRMLMLWRIACSLQQSHSTRQSRLTKSISPAIDTKTATKVSVWTAPRKTCTYQGNYAWHCTSGKETATACLKARMPIVHRPYPNMAS